jgi:biopolymer transport protein ExbB
VRKLLAALILLIPAVSQAWWSDDWNFRKEISFDLSATGANIGGSPLDAPVLVRLHAGNFTYFGDTKPDGSDIRFIAGDDKTPIKFHIERYDATSQLAYIWVRVPRITGGTNTDKIYMYYGNPKAVAASDPAGTYDANQALVLHFGEKAGPPLDSTANGNKASASTAEFNAASLIGGGLKLSGTGAVTVPASASLRLLPTRGMEMSAWVRIGAEQNDAYVMALQDQNSAIVLGINGVLATARVFKGGAVVSTLQSGDLTTGQWQHLALDISAGRMSLYVNGVSVGAMPVPIVETAGALTIGGAAQAGHGLVGELDEAQFSGAGRSAELIQAAAMSQGMDAKLVAYGGDAQRETQKVSYFATTLKNVTIDGWVVIGILAVMFVIAVMIMAGKTVYLLRVAQADRKFLREFEKLTGDPTALDRPETEDGDEALDRSALAPPISGGGNGYGLSTLYRLYHHGVQEMTGRIGLKSAGAAAVTTLTPQAIAAIRATLDATQVRLGQKLQSQMVLLTIAISGGPFLGLLGTVVGVMITFAAIAASGDVNVNAIAPGIAAALAATVAGLAVAIPSLFGYNWLNTRIKEINADMRVFVDQFVTRVAEHYS